MRAEHWQRVEALYHAARAHNAQDRAAFLTEACAGDETLRRDVESLLAQPVSRDGQRSLLNAPPEPEDLTPITVVLNWKTVLTAIPWCGFSRSIC
jgi:serine/threonine-protein kinase